MHYSDLFSFSTSWNVSRHTSGKAMLQEIMALGFQRVELNYKVTAEMVEEITPMIDRGEVEITSIHNVFPRIYDEEYGTDSLLLGHVDGEKRKQAIDLTIQSVNFAARYGAKAVVIHPGEIPVPKNYYDILEKMILEGQRHSKQYAELLEEMQYFRRKGSETYRNLIRNSLEQICNHIGKKDYPIILGIENRMKCHQIPDFEEANILLNKLQELPVRFWFDTGHGLLQEQMGVFDNLKGVQSLQNRIIGTHIHDVVGRDDHLCPYLYTEQLDKYLPVLKDIPIKVLELNAGCLAQDIPKSAEILMNKLCK